MRILREKMKNERNSLFENLSGLNAERLKINAHFIGWIDLIYCHFQNVSIQEENVIDFLLKRPNSLNTLYEMIRDDECSDEKVDKYLSKFHNMDIIDKLYK
jgi:hypothetical protein